MNRVEIIEQRDARKVAQFAEPVKPRGIIRPSSATRLEREPYHSPPGVHDLRERHDGIAAGDLPVANHIMRDADRIDLARDRARAQESADISSPCGQFSHEFARIVHGRSLRTLPRASPKFGSFALTTLATVACIRCA